MARIARKIAVSGVYHVAFRPKAGRLVFYDASDVAFFLDLCNQEHVRDALDMFAFCFLEHAAHFVVREGLSGLTANFMRIFRAYAAYCNKTYRMEGKLVDGRFYSAPLELPDEIADATRFVHRLPLAEGHTLSYAHSSYRDYFKQTEQIKSDEILSLLPAAVDYRIYCDSPHTGRFRKL